MRHLECSHPLKLNLKTVKHFELNIGYSLKALTYFTSHKKNNTRELLLIQVKNGKSKKRTVYNPSPEYKRLLRTIHSRFLQKSKLLEGVLGGVIGKNIDGMVKIHCGKEAVLSIDLKDFFPSIKSGRVFNFFVETGCKQDIAGILTDIVTLNGALPQGFPTSPMLANLIAFNLDVQHIKMCKAIGVHRTRWIDDIVFSGRSKDLVENMKSLLGTIKPHGFRLSNRKTEFVVRPNHPTVCGLDVSGKHPQIPYIVIDKIRDILDECILSGVDNVQASYECDCFGRKKNLKQSLEGKIRYISQYNKDDGSELSEKLNSINWYS